MNPYYGAYIIDLGDGDKILEKPRSINVTPLRTTHTVLEGETLQNIAFRYYGNSGYWTKIAEANNIFFQYTELEAGMELIIPQ